MLQDPLCCVTVAVPGRREAWCKCPRAGLCCTTLGPWDQSAQFTINKKLSLAERGSHGWCGEQTVSPGMLVVSGLLLFSLSGESGLDLPG